MRPTRENRDEDFVEAGREGAGPVLAAAHRTTGEGRPIPPAGTAWPEQGGMGRGRGAGLAPATDRPSRRT